MNYRSLTEFKKFVDREILPATRDLEKLADAHRKHVQKLIYTNLVDRFDTTVDQALLDNCRDDILVSAAAQRLTQPIKESDLLQLLLQSETLQDALEAKLKPSYVLKDDGRILAEDAFGNRQTQSQEYVKKGDKVYRTDALGRAQYHKPHYEVSDDGEVVEKDSFGNTRSGRPSYEVEGDTVYETDAMGHVLRQVGKVEE